MNEQDIPIDIHTGKLQEWLVSRRIVQKNWQNGIRNVRDKINNAIKDMPADARLVELLSGAHINYFHCLQIIAILKQTEVDSKNVFGMYRSKRMIDWQDVVKIYEKDNLYLAEAAQILVRNTQYEIPSIKKQIAKLEQLSDEAEKKIIDLGKSENIILSEHTQLCQQLGIEGKSVRKELVEKLKELPALHETIAKLFPSLMKAMKLYKEFNGGKDCLQYCYHIAENGNTTWYQYLYSEAPLTIETPAINIDVNIDDETNKVNFDEDNSNAINFDDLSIDDVKLDVGEIDWGNTNEIIESNEIDFDITLEESGIVVEDDGQAGGVARDEEAHTFLDFPKYRDRVIDELMELEAFLRMRLYELSVTNNSTIISVSLLEAFGEHDKESIEVMLQNVNVVLSQINEPLIQHLCQVKYSVKYVDILAGKLQQKLNAIKKIKINTELSKEKSKRFLKEAQELKPTLNRIIDQTKTLQEQIENDISKRYKNRVVNLMGGINVI